MLKTKLMVILCYNSTLMETTNNESEGRTCVGYRTCNWKLKLIVFMGAIVNDRCIG